MSVVLWLLAASICVQFGTCVLAFRLNWVHGWRWAWSLITLAVALMMVRRCLTFHRLLMGELVEPDDLTYEGASGFLPPAIVTFVVSVLMLAGVAFIEPFFRMLYRAEKILQDEKDQLTIAMRLADAEFAAAREIQQLIFPSDPPALTGYDIAGASSPALACGGDFFDFLPMSEDALGIVVGDVSGHGLGPALVAAQLNAYLRAVTQSHDDPAKVLAATDRLIATPVLSGRFVTMFFARVDAKGHRVVYGAAGQQAYVLRSSGEVEPLEISSQPLGISADMEMTTASQTVLEPDDLLFIPTDGIHEAMNPQGALFGSQRMLEVVRFSRAKTAAEIIQLINQEVRQFTGSDSQLDDVTCVVVKRRETR